MKNRIAVILVFILAVLTASCKFAANKVEPLEECEDLRNAQASFIVDDFSDKYFGKIYLYETWTNEWSEGYVYGDGLIVIFDRQTGRQLIKQSSESMSVYSPDGQHASYDRQDAIIYDDFNFDGVKDFALTDGRFGNYGERSYQIYLATENGFEYRADFTELAQNYFGMFGIDKENQLLRTWARGGCCWHQAQTFVVENNRPVLIEVWERGFDETGTIAEITETKRIDGEMVTRKYREFNWEDYRESIIYTFTFANQKRMQLFNKDNERLFYIFTDKDNEVELFFGANQNFEYSLDDNYLRFRNGDTTYTITPDGITVTMPSRTVNMQAVADTRIGRLENILNINFENVLHFVY